MTTINLIAIIFLNDLFRKYIFLVIGRIGRFVSSSNESKSVDLKRYTM
jgi:hypothetical protein